MNALIAASTRQAGSIAGIEVSWPPRETPTHDHSAYIADIPSSTSARATRRYIHEPHLIQYKYSSTPMMRGERFFYHCLYPANLKSGRHRRPGRVPVRAASKRSSCHSMLRPGRLVKRSRQEYGWITHPRVGECVCVARGNIPPWSSSRDR